MNDNITVNAQHVNLLKISSGSLGVIVDNGLVWDHHGNKLIADYYTPLILADHGVPMNIPACCSEKPCHNHIRELAYSFYKDDIDHGRDPESAEFNWERAEQYLLFRCTKDFYL